MKCQVALTTSAPTLAAGGATGAVTVSTQPECAWTATAEASWISGLSPDSGQGSGQVAFQAAANPLPTARQGEIVVNNNRVSIRQDGATCAFQIAPLDQSVPAAGGTGRITVTGTAGCAWTAVANEQWLSITSGASGSGGGTVTFTIGPHVGLESRTGTLTIAGRTFTVTQAAASCVYTIAPTSQSISASGGAGTTVTVATTAGCPWSAISNDAWLTVTSGASGNGAGTATFTIAQHVEPTPRTGTLTIAGQPFTVNQAAASCAYAIAPPNQSISASGGAGTTVTVTTMAGCEWTAVSNDAWLTVTSGASGNGGGTVTFTVAQHVQPTARAGTLTIAGQTFTVNQAAAPCATQSRRRVSRSARPEGPGRMSPSRRWPAVRGRPPATTRG